MIALEVRDNGFTIRDACEPAEARNLCGLLQNLFYFFATCRVKNAGIGANWRPKLFRLNWINKEIGLASVTAVFVNGMEIDMRLQYEDGQPVFNSIEKTKFLFDIEENRLLPWAIEFQQLVGPISWEHVVRGSRHTIKFFLDLNGFRRLQYIQACRANRHLPLRWDDPEHPIK